MVKKFNRLLSSIIFQKDSWYWLVPVLLIIIQSIYIFQSLNYIRYEDLAESVRNAFWLEQRTIYDGTSSNVGWYGTMLLIYKVFGFHIYTARYYRVFLFSISILLLAFGLRKHFAAKASLIPLITIGLSPTILYLNTFQATYGLDIHYFVIIATLVMLIRQNRRQRLMLLFLAGALTMWTAMTYPSGIFLFPAIGLLLMHRLLKLNLPIKQLIHSLIISLIGFTTPFILMLLYLRDPMRLIFDTLGGQGIFRGSGRLALSLLQFLSNSQDILGDLFLWGISAQFELPHVEFSGLYPILAFAAVLVVTYKAYYNQSKYKSLILISTLLIITGFGGSSLSSHGMRTAIPALAGFYGLFIVAYMFTFQSKKTIARIVILIVLILLPIHHLLNLLPNLKFEVQPSKFAYRLSGFDGNPHQQLEALLSVVQAEPLAMSCQDSQGEYITCRYQESYAAVAGACLWNNLDCHPIYGYDVKSQQFIPLHPDLWLSYYWGH